MTEVRTHTVSATLALLGATALTGFLYASRDVQSTLGRVGIATLLLGVIAPLAWASTTGMTSLPRVQLWMRAITSAGVLVAVAIARVPLVLAGFVGIAAALSLADAIGMLRAPTLARRAGARVSDFIAGLFKLGYRMGVALLLVLVTAEKVAPDHLEAALGALFHAVGALFPNNHISAFAPLPSIRFRTFDAAVAPADAATDVPTSTRVLRPLANATVGVPTRASQMRRVEAGSPTETADGVRRWLAQTDAARALQRKMASLQQQNPRARITRAISRQNECGFVVTYPTGVTEGWLYDTASRSVVPAEWSLSPSAP